jgi:hypothetical protein
MINLDLKEKGNKVIEEGYADLVATVSRTSLIQT